MRFPYQNNLSLLVCQVKAKLTPPCIGEILNGPLALVLWFFGLVPFAAISFMAGALVSRFGWIAVGKVSGADPESVFAAERQ